MRIPWALIAHPRPAPPAAGWRRPYRRRVVLRSAGASPENVVTEEAGRVVVAGSWPSSGSAMGTAWVRNRCFA